MDKQVDMQLTLNAKVLQTDSARQFSHQIRKAEPNQYLNDPVAPG